MLASAMVIILKMGSEGPKPERSGLWNCCEIILRKGASNEDQSRCLV